MKKVLFWITVFPLFIVVTFFDTLEWFATVIRCVNEVIHVLMFRYEHWAYDVEKEYFMNSPWRYSLKEVWNKEYNN